MFIEQLLADAKISITGYKPNNKKPYVINDNRPCNMEGLCEAIVKGLGVLLTTNYASMIESLVINKNIEDVLLPYLTEKFYPKTEPVVVEIPKEFENVVLNTDFETGEYFLTRDDVVLNYDAKKYGALVGIKEHQIPAQSRFIGRKYNPLSEDRIIAVDTPEGEKMTAINTYIEPKWKKEYRTDKANISLFIKFIDHLLPIEEEREYFYAWSKAALTSRAYTYLVLSGRGGNGKNTLKEVFRGLVGGHNLVDGKMSTVKERFNGQLENTKILWGDEWKFGFNEEPVLKEIQNDTISIERKGIDATRSTKIYCSMVITNNYPEHNYIAFESRKFVPLLMTKNELSDIMASDEIVALKNSGNPSAEEYDPDFVASVYKYILDRGDETRFKNLEYKGPGFYLLANSTMFKWQKFLLQVLSFIFTFEQGQGDLPQGYFKKSGWEKIHPKLNKTKMNWMDIQPYLDTSSRISGVSEFPSNLKIRTFLNSYRDANGDKVFEVGGVKEYIEDFTIKYVKDNPEIVDDEDFGGL
jgi:hypothetical protein